MLTLEVDVQGLIEDNSPTTHTFPKDDLVETEEAAKIEEITLFHECTQSQGARQREKPIFFN